MILTPLRYCILLAVLIMLPVANASSPASVDEFRSIGGGKISEGIGLLLKAMRRSENRVEIKVLLKNSTDSEYRIADLEVLRRYESGFLSRDTREQYRIDSVLHCVDGELTLKPKSDQLCVVSFTLPPRQTKREHIGLRLVEASRSSRIVTIKRILEIYE